MKMQNNTLKSRAKELKKEGFTFKQIADMLGTKRSTVWDWVNDRRRGNSITSAIVSTPVPYIHIPVIRSEEKYEDIKDFIAQLAPIHYPAPPRSAVTEKATKTALVIGDIHFGSEDWNVLNIFLQAVQELKPETVILNGDTLDMFAISRYPKDVRHYYSLSEEREAYHKFLKMLHDVSAPFNSKIYETNANHSGDGNEGRWWRYLSDRIGEIADVPEIKQKLSYSSVFLPTQEWSRMELVDYVEVAPGFIVMHGDVVRRHGGYSARGLFEKWFTSIMANHTHRAGMSSQRIPSIGSQSEKIVRVYENGCACNLQPIYASAANWQNGFSIINYSDDNVGVETVIVSNKRATVTALGKTLKAE